MFRLRLWLRAFFGFSRQESNAFVILLPAMVILIIGLPLYQSIRPFNKLDFSVNQKKLDSIILLMNEQQAKDSIQAPRRFKFNPNLASVDDLVKLGFTESVAKRLIQYRSKGGKFTIKKDLLKLYGLDTALYLQLLAYIDLPDEKVKETQKKVLQQDPESAQTSKFDINKADTTALKRIYGIGSKLSLRIIKYRESLGGFISLSQLHEVWGLDSVVVSKLKEKSFIDGNFQPKKIPLNTFQEKDFAKHPYINFTLAKAIVAYRYQHGFYQSVNEILKISILTEQQYKKLEPYLSITDQQ